MSINLQQLFKLCNPSTTLNAAKPEDRKLYIDFFSVRGSNVIRELYRTITLLARDEPSCQLFTGHIGCGKSTELLRLKHELEQENYHVVYFESSRILDMADVDVTDILLAITQQVSESLEQVEIKLQPSYFQRLFNEIKELLTGTVELDMEAVLSVGIAKITAKTKQSPSLRKRLRQHLEPRTNNILESINEEFLNPAQVALKQQSSAGLVVIVDNLDRVDNSRKASGRYQPEYLFIDRAEQLKGLNCNLIYTVPLVLAFSNEFGRITNRFGVAPKILPMVPVKQRDSSQDLRGLALLRRMVLVRAFPDYGNQPIPESQLLPLLFENPQNLNALGTMSGGHVRTLLGLIYRCLQRDDPPIPQACVAGVVQQWRGELIKAIAEPEWQHLRRVKAQKQVQGEEGYELLLRSLFVYEYHDRNGSWFDINPFLLNATQLKLNNQSR
jgi:hypothetical protein